MWRRSSLLGLIVVLGATAERYEAVEPHMGTLARITVYAPSAEAARDAFEHAFRRIRELDVTLSDYKPDSEVNELRRNAPGAWRRVSGELFSVLSAAQRYAGATQGAFDITLGGGYHFLELRAGGEARVLKAGMRLDLGGIGKGFAADEALKVLRERGLPNALVAMSGDIAVGDPPPGERGWRIEVAPDTATTVVKVANAGVSTSGQSGQGAHIVRGTSGGAIAVSVIADTATDADATATACVALGTRRCLKWLTASGHASALLAREPHLYRVGVAFKKP